MRLFIAFAAAAPLVLQAQQAPPRPQQPPPPLIRSQVTIVPIDIRVIDRDGKPVQGLTADDFEVFEDGVPQAIRHFSSHTFTPDPSARDAAPRFRRAIEETTQAPNRRVFLIMLGRGRHQAVSKYVDELSGFIKQLNPQDQVAIMAWNRATDFTSDHELTLRVLARYRERSEHIETRLREWFSGLRAVYGSPDIPAHIQREIDAIYAVAPELRPRELTPIAGADQTARRRGAKVASDDIQRNEILKTFPEASFLPDTRAEIVSELADMPFDEYVQQSSEVMQDLGGLYRAIDYLRYLEGEKHLLYLTERGINLPMLPGNRTLADVASDARIALNIVQTGGVVGPAPPQFVMTANGSQLRMSPVASAGAVMRQGFSMQDLRMVAEVTGGSLAAFQSPESP
jgi:VWFA-related protein